MKLNKIYSHNKSPYSEKPNNFDQINLFWEEMKYINEEGHSAKKSDINPNETFARSMYEYNSTRNKLARKTAKALLLKRENFHKKHIESNFYPELEILSGTNTKHYTFNPDNMYEDGFIDKNEKSDNDDKKFDLKYNIRNNRPNFGDKTINGIRKLYEDKTETPEVYKGPLYKDRILMAKNLVRYKY